MNVTSPAAVRDILSRYQLACRKSLGQNFLVDHNIAGKIVMAAELLPSDLVVEIGPGLGGLTTIAAGRAAKVLAVEIDRGLVKALAEIMAGMENVAVIQGDALETDLDQLAQEQTGGVFGPGGRKYKLLANMPYYITTPLLLHLLHEHYNISLMVIMVQLEVAARLTAAPGTKDYGALSVAVQYFTEAKLLFRVPKTVFFPTPAVDSAVVRLVVRQKPAVQVRDEETFFRIVRAAFGKRRKTLLNSLAGSDMGISKDLWKTALDSCGIDPDRRGETLSLGEFARITDSISKILNA